MKAIENGNGNNPDWYNGISKATTEQEKKKIDLIVHTTFGDIFVQIKSSEVGAKKFLNEINKSHFKIVLFGNKRHDSEETIREISFLAIKNKVDYFSNKRPSC